MSFGRIKYSFPFLVTFVTFFNCLITILKTVTKHNPYPYIDEIFHIPQAQLYCEYVFNQWDDKITTLPGLYVVSLAILKPLEWALKLELSSVYGLRFVNVVGTLVNLLLAYCIQQKLSPVNEQKGRILDVMSAINVAAFPPLFFFTFLFYTDVWSTAFVLLTYFLHLSDAKFMAGFAGICAVMMRQTNIIWVGLLTLDSAWTSIAGLEKESVTSVYGAIQVVINRLSVRSLARSVLDSIPYLAVCSFFVAFVIINRGIVVGDRSAHEVVLHPMQNLYFLNVAAFFAIPYALWEMKPLVMNTRKWSFYFLLAIGCAVLSEYNLLEHPYLLADNRHLAFYIWRRSFGHPVLRRWITPTYAISGVILYSLLKRMNLVFLVSFALCTVLNLTPQYLFEIRYFIIPFILARLHFPQRTFSVYLETFFFAVINIATFYIFLTRQFTWDSDPNAIQRIIW